MRALSAYIITTTPAIATSQAERSSTRPPTGSSPRSATQQTAAAPTSSARPQKISQRPTSEATDTPAEPGEGGATITGGAGTRTPNVNTPASGCPSTEMFCQLTV